MTEQHFSSPQCLQWNALTVTQQGAFTKILRLLEITVKHHWEQKDGIFPKWFKHEQQSAFAFVSGEHGTSGKTTLLLSLIRALCIKDAGNPVLQTLLEFLNPRVLLCEPLDLALPVPHIDLLSAILVRIDQAVQDHIGVNKNPRSPLEEDCEQLGLLRQFQIRGVKALSNNLQARKKFIDRDAYAGEIVDQESERLNFSNTFNNLLEQLSGEISRRSPFRIYPHEVTYFLPIDNFDSSVTRCQKARNIINLLSSNKVFFLLLGDLENMKLSDSTYWIPPGQCFSLAPIAD